MVLKILLVQLLFCIVSILFLPINAVSEVVAFPGAEGFGCRAIGGRGGDVYYVMNLNDSGPGSFRDAVSQSHRTVLFSVSGIINIKERIVVSDHVTIAGQSAPGDGVVIYGNGISFSGADHVIVRYMRFRMGAGGTKGKDAVGIAQGSPMIFDHVSVSWGRDETFSINGEDGYYTIQDSIIAQGLHSHSCGGLLQNWGGISILRSLYIDNHTRNPKVKGVNQFVNNVIYNWRTAGYILGDSSAESRANIVNNYFISGPDTGSKPAFTRANENFHLFAENNYHDSNRNGVLDGIVIQQSDYGPVTWQSTRYVFPNVRTLYSPQTAYKIVTSQSGASLPVRDPVDQYLIRELTSLGQYGRILSNEDQLPTRGPGTLEGGSVPTDTDQDGMPDFWEKAIDGLDFQNKDNNGDINLNGYTNLEDYLNWVAMPHVRVNQAETIIVDLRHFNRGFGERAVYQLDAQKQDIQVSFKGHLMHLTPTTDMTGVLLVNYIITDTMPVSRTIAVLVSSADVDS